MNKHRTTEIRPIARSLLLHMATLFAALLSSFVCTQSAAAYDPNTMCPDMSTVTCVDEACGNTVVVGGYVTCTSAPVPRERPDCTTNSCNEQVGDPIDATYGNGFEDRTDLELLSPLYDLKFRRYYSTADATFGGIYPNDFNSSTVDSNEHHTSFISLFPAPFGSPIHWWDNYYSFASVSPADATYPASVYIRDQRGTLAKFVWPSSGTPMSSTPTWLTPATSMAALRDRLYWDGTQFVFVEENGVELIFSTVAYPTGESQSYPQSPFYFLSQVRNRSGVTVASITYGQPKDTSGAPLAGCTSSETAAGAQTWTPYVNSVTNPTTGQALAFSYKALTDSSSHVQCVIAKIQEADGSGSAGASTTYTYSGTPEAPGLVYQATQPDKTLSYTYAESPNFTFSVKNDSLLLGQQTYDTSDPTKPPGVTYVAEYESIRFDTPADPPTIIPYIENNTHQGFDRHAYDEYASAGDGTNTVNIVDHTYESASQEPFLDEAQGTSHLVLSETSTSPWAIYSDSSSSSPGLLYHNTWFDPTGSAFDPDVPSTNGSNDAHPSGMEDARGSWEAYAYASPSNNPAAAPNAAVAADGTYFGRLLELTTVSEGATDALGSNAIQTYQNTYTYPGTYRDQLLSSTSNTSTLSPANQATTKVYYDSSNSVTAVVRTGYTYLPNSGSPPSGPTKQAIGVFYFQNYACSGNAATDPNHRTLEVHGPCLVDPASTNPNDCNGSGLMPVTQYTYGSDGQLSLIRRFTTTTYTNGAVSCPVVASPPNYLDTSITQYSPAGDPMTVTTNGIVRDYTYTADHLLYTVSSPHVPSGFGTSDYQLAYDNGYLQSIRLPKGFSGSGMYVVFCHRAGTSTMPTGSCSSTDRLSKNVQWLALAPSADGSSWTERIDYQYASDGTPLSATYLAPGGVIRKVERSGSDGLKRLTTAWKGNPTDLATSAFTAGATADVWAYDLAGDLTALGHSFNQPPAACVDTTQNPPVSAKCESLTHDALGRITSATQPVSGGPAASVSLSYSNKPQIEPSGAAIGCVAGTTGCPTATYVYDDFDRLVASTVPWRQAATTYFSYDALGDLTTMWGRGMTDPQSGAAEWLEYTYDAVGRLLNESRNWVGASQPDTLTSRAYDSNAVAQTNCPPVTGATNTLGRLAEVTDSFGTTWFTYNLRGEVTGEYRVRASAASAGCNATASHDNPNTTYAYDGYGRLTGITYPYGRTVTYNYPNYGPRISSMSVTTTADGTTWVAGPSISNITWEPFGGLSGYEIDNGTTAFNLPNQATVQYLIGGSSTTRPASCSDAIPSVTSGYDSTGRPKAVWVTNGAYNTSSLGSPIFRRYYTWNGDLVSRTDTCALGNTGTPYPTQDLIYDAVGRITDNIPANSGNQHRESVSYNARGNVTSRNYNVTLFNYNQSYNAAYPDQLSSLTESIGYPVGLTSNWQYNYGAYNADGTVHSITTHNELSPANPGETITLNGGPGTSTNSASELAIQSVGLNGSYYNYFYDYMRRRRLKAYPTGDPDEYFYSPGSNLLVDQGNQAQSYASGQAHVHPVDDYVWLAGRPVMIIRGSLDQNWARLGDNSADTTGACSRELDGANCGFYFPASDNIGRPILMLNGSFQISDMVDYDAQGNPNRFVTDTETAHGYAGAVTGIDYFNVAPPAGMAQTVRAKFNELDMLTSGCLAGTSDGIQFIDLNSLSPLLLNSSGSPRPFTGRHQGVVWSPWVSPSSGSGFRVDLVTGTNQPNICTRTCYLGGRFTCCALGCGASQSNTSSGPAYGAIIESYEYRTSQLVGTTPVKPFWTPLRAPGQYHDEETDWFQNWNRFYDPVSARYLEPDPLWDSPDPALAAASMGVQWPVYGYAANNPVNFVDSDGFFPIPGSLRPFLKSEFPTLDLDNVDVEIGIPDSVMSANFWFQQLGHGSRSHWYFPEAVTVGKTIYFNPAYYNYRPGSHSQACEETVNTFGHELQHVAQYETQGSNVAVWGAVYGLMPDLWEDQASEVGAKVEQDYDNWSGGR